MFLAADKLRKNLEPSDYKHVALGLIFLKHISNAFEAKRAELLAEDPAAAEDPDEYLAENVFWVPKEVPAILIFLGWVRVSVHQRARPFKRRFCVLQKSHLAFPAPVRQGKGCRRPRERTISKSLAATSIRKRATTSFLLPELLQLLRCGFLAAGALGVGHDRRHPQGRRDARIVRRLLALMPSCSESVCVALWSRRRSSSPPMDRRKAARLVRSPPLYNHCSRAPVL